VTAADGFGAWLRRQREQRLWTRTELARRIIQSARDHGDTTMPGTGSLAHNLYRWERGANGISDRYRLYCCDVLGAQPARPVPPDRASSGGKLIVIMITLPDGIEVRVRIVDPADASGQNVTARLRCSLGRAGHEHARLVGFFGRGAMFSTCLITAIMVDMAYKAARLTSSPIQNTRLFRERGLGRPSSPGVSPIRCGRDTALRAP
jgi:hypothetical protein